MSLWNSIASLGISGAVQIVVLWIAYYYILVFFRGTRGAQVLVGLGLMLGVLIGLAQFANLGVLSWILRNATIYLAVGLVIIFQPEIRRALAELGRQSTFSSGSEASDVIARVVDSVVMLAEKKTGALIAFERNIGTKSIQETGVKLDAEVTPELLDNIFFPRTPLHDGGVIIAGDRIVAAGCLFPLSDEAGLDRTLGTRHRAALGMSEETDAVIIIVSEESGTISGCHSGELSHGMNREQLHKFLSNLLIREKDNTGVWRRMRRHLDFTPRGLAKSEGLNEEEGGSGR